MPKRIFIIGLLLATAFSLSAGGSAEKEKPLKVGILPDADSLPFMVAAEEGLFSARGVAVELVLFHNPVERDAAFQAGEVDGIIADTIGSILSVAAGMDAAITSITSGRYGLAAAPGTNVSTVGDLAGKEVGVSSNTVIEYVASRLFTAAGLAAEDFVPLAVPKIPVRMELLLNGKLPAACLPEPLYSLVLSKGAVPLGDSASLGMAPGVMLFRRSITETRTAELGRFYDAYWQACSAINTDPGSYRDFIWWIPWAFRLQSGRVLSLYTMITPAYRPKVRFMKPAAGCRPGILSIPFPY